jgi:hypothetical protein
MLLVQEAWFLVKVEAMNNLWLVHCNEIRVGPITSRGYVGYNKILATRYSQ